MPRRTEKGGTGGVVQGHDAVRGTGAGASREIDALFQLPLSEFTAARNALAARLKKAGTVADDVKALPKPSVSAWVVNQLYWRHRKPFEQLVEAGERFRTAQAEQLSGRSADLRGPLEARREALAALSRLAADTLREAGHPVTPEMMRRITTTLEAFAAYGMSAGGITAGRLTDDIQPPGFDAIAALIPRPGGDSNAGPSRVLPFRRAPRPSRRPASDPKASARRDAEARKAAIVRARAAVKEAEHRLRELRSRAHHAEAALKAAAARTRKAEQERADAEMRLEKAAAAVEAARQEGRRVAAEAEEAAQAVRDAELALERAKKEVGLHFGPERTR